MSEDADPFELFERWLGEALQAEGEDPAAMALATVGRDGMPTSRIVMMRGFDRHGLVFYTDCDSPKGHDLAENPRAAVAFHWSALSRQVRAAGPVSRIADEEADRYFASRPREARIAAWIPQSRVVENRAALEAEFASLGERFADGEVPRPPFWVGYRLTPDEWEFWRSGKHRLHDRVRYRRDASDAWIVECLTP